MQRGVNVSIVLIGLLIHPPGALLGREDVQASEGILAKVWTLAS